MFFKVIFLLMVSTMGHAAEQAKTLSGKIVTIHFMEEEKGEYPLEFVNYSKYLENMTESLSDSDAGHINLHTIKLKNFRYLMAIIKGILVNPPEAVPLAYEESFTAFATIIPDAEKRETLKQLLIDANFLEVPFKLKRALAYEYMKTIDKNIVPITIEGQIISFDGLPPDLNVLIAGWLLYELLTQKEWNHKDLLLTKEVHLDINFDAVISSPAAKHMFTIVWQQKIGLEILTNALETHIPSLDFYQSSPASTVIDFVSKKLFKLPRYTPKVSKCALSDDGKYLLSIVSEDYPNQGKQKDNTVYIYLFPGAHTIELHKDPDNDVLINKIVFNHMTQNFFIIANKSRNVSKESDSPLKKQSLCIYEINPKTNKKTDAVFDMSDSTNLISYTDIMQWHCVGKDLVGAWYSIKQWDVILYNSELKEFFTCKQNQYGEWFYETKDSKRHEVNCTIARSDSSRLDSKDSIIIVQSFVPYFEMILTNSFKKIAKFLPYYKKIDWEHFRVNFYEHKSDTTSTYIVGMYYFFPPHLSSALLLLNEMVNTGDTATLLTDTILTYQRYMHPTEWQERYKTLIEYGSPKIKRLLDISIVPVPQAAQDEGFWKNLKQNIGQFWASPQQYITTAWSRYQKTARMVGIATTIGLGTWIISKYASKRHNTSQTHPG